jgi:hypothetical protein
MKIFKELNKLGYIHYSATTIEELDDLPLNSAERISEQALVLRWFREKYELLSWVFTPFGVSNGYFHEIVNLSKVIIEGGFSSGQSCQYNTYEEAELACLKKLIEIVKEKS